MPPTERKRPETSTARSAREAVEVLEKNLPRFGLVILDMIMSDRGGEASFNRLKDIHPEVKVLLPSATRVDSAASRMLAEGCRGFVQKPFWLQELSKKMREILG